MVQVNGFFASVYLAVIYSSLALAAPFDSTAPPNFATHYVHTIGKRSLEVVSFNPPASFETLGDGVDLPASATASFLAIPLEDKAVGYTRERLGVDADAIALKNGHTAGDTSYFYLSQQHDGVKFANSHANVVIRDDKVVAFGSSFVDPKNIAPSSPSVSVKDAIAAAEEALSGKDVGFDTTIEYLVLQDLSVELVHVIHIDSEESGNIYKAFVNAETGVLRSVSSLSSEASYRALPITKQNPTEGVEMMEDPENMESSPKGWHHSANGTTTDTSGNNAVAYVSSNANTTGQSADGQVFDYTWDNSTDPKISHNIDAARTNAFYIVNLVHDVWYKYGFTEDAFNFQSDNFDKGGKGSDPVMISVQDGSGTNNARFTTYGDGQPGLMQMFLWDKSNPRRDGSLENDIIVHEFGHGLSNRLTGGGTGSCLGTVEAGGMGEGWSDALAEWFTQGGEFKDYELGNWAGGGPNIRRYPYSTNANTNPLRYSNVGDSKEVHKIGEIWANTLHNVHSALREKYVYASDALTNPDSKGGNTVFLHLLIDGLKLQPCNPTFVNARDAWIQADANRYGGENQCLLWKAFASRGLGTEAAQKDGKYVDSDAVPEACR